MTAEELADRCFDEKWSLTRFQEEWVTLPETERQKLQDAITIAKFLELVNPGLLEEVLKK